MDDEVVHGWHWVDETSLELLDGDRVQAGRAYSLPDGVPPVMCETGYHASRFPLQALYYARGSYASHVALSGQILYGLDKLCATKRTVLACGNASEILRGVRLAIAQDIFLSEQYLGNAMHREYGDAIRLAQHYEESQRYGIESGLENACAHLYRDLTASHEFLYGATVVIPNYYKDASASMRDAHMVAKNIIYQALNPRHVAHKTVFMLYQLLCDYSMHLHHVGVPYMKVLGHTIELSFPYRGVPPFDDIAAPRDSDGQFHVTLSRAHYQMNAQADFERDTAQAINDWLTPRLTSFLYQKEK